MRRCLCRSVYNFAFPRISTTQSPASIFGMFSSFRQKPERSHSTRQPTYGVIELQSVEPRLDSTRTVTSPRHPFPWDVVLPFRSAAQLGLKRATNSILLLKVDLISEYLVISPLPADCEITGPHIDDACKEFTSSHAAACHTEVQVAAIIMRELGYFGSGLWQRCG